MADFIRVASIDEVPPGNVKEVQVGDRVVALLNVDGQYYAIDGVCPHQGGPLGEGFLDGHIVTCPWHGWQFDVTTGQHTLAKKIRQDCFEVKVEGNDVLVSSSPRERAG